MLKPLLYFYDTSLNESQGGFILGKDANITPPNKPNGHIGHSKNERHENYNETLVLTNEPKETSNVIPPFF